MTTDPSPQDYRTALGSFATGVTIVCAQHNGEIRGFTANSFSSVSLKPPLVSVCLDNQAQCMDVFSQCEHFSISVLARNQEHLADRFAYFQGDRFADIDWQKTPLGCPMIDNSYAWFDCICETRFNLGDHVMLIGKVQSFDFTDKGLSPLVFLRGNYLAEDIL